MNKRKYSNGVVLVHFPEDGKHGCGKHCGFCYFEKVGYNIPITPSDEEILGFLQDVEPGSIIQICGAGDPLYNFDKNGAYLLHVAGLIRDAGYSVQLVTKYFEVVKDHLSELSAFDSYSFSAEERDEGLKALVSALTAAGKYVRITKIANFTPDIYTIDVGALEAFAAFYSDVANKDMLSICFRPNFNFDYKDADIFKERGVVYAWTAKYGCYIYMQMQSKRLGNPQLWNGRVIRCGDTRE